MLDLDWMKETLKEAMEKEDWDLVREVIAYLSDDDVFEQYREDEDWWKGADDKDWKKYLTHIKKCDSDDSEKFGAVMVSTGVIWQLSAAEFE